MRTTATARELFMDLVAIPSPSGRELRLATAIRQWLADIGVNATFDGTGERNNSDSGNLVATIPGDPNAPHLLFVSHMDTVEDGSVPVTPILGADGIIRADGQTILGADNKSAVAAVMSLCRELAATDEALRPTVTAAFTCREESGRMGASLLQLETLRVDCAFGVDGSQPIGRVITRALGQCVFDLAVFGRSSHAAAKPEAGVNAIRVASEIIAALPLGRQPAGGSLNIAAAVGGSMISGINGELAGADRDRERARRTLRASATNIVPDTALMRGEARGYSSEEIESLIQTVDRVAGDVCTRLGGRHEMTVDIEDAIPPLPGGTGSLALELYREAVSAVAGIEFVVLESKATLEANYLAPLCDTVAMSSGGRDPHEPSEYIAAEEIDLLEHLLLAIARRSLAART